MQVTVCSRRPWQPVPLAASTNTVTLPHSPPSQHCWFYHTAPECDVVCPHSAWQAYGACIPTPTSLYVRQVYSTPSFMGYHSAHHTCMLARLPPRCPCAHAFCLPRLILWAHAPCCPCSLLPRPLIRGPYLSLPTRPCPCRAVGRCARTFNSCPYRRPPRVPANLSG
jgi:hypothetical protein